MIYHTIIVDQCKRVGIITLNRPQVRNALSKRLIDELAHSLDQLESSPHIAVIIVRGSEEAFAAGVDIQELQSHLASGKDGAEFLAGPWQRLAQCRVPTIAAVAGYTLGGGLELAMMCDLIMAADNSVFGQPEVRLGIMPGIGGTQRLSRAIGKARAMKMCLTGTSIGAVEAESWGLVSQVLPLKTWWADVQEMALKMSNMSKPTALLIKQAINQAQEALLTEGLERERELFCQVLALEDAKEGVAAFLEKRLPSFKHR